MCVTQPPLHQVYSINRTCLVEYVHIHKGIWNLRKISFCMVSDALTTISLLSPAFHPYIQMVNTSPFNKTTTFSLNFHMVNRANVTIFLNCFGKFGIYPLTWRSFCHLLLSKDGDNAYTASILQGGNSII